MEFDPAHVGFDGEDRLEFFALEPERNERATVVPASFSKVTDR
ncbi:hypothetical protein BDIM_30260 [Brevundimonas diminuta ATCC 11568]|nr:hypothetical protein BDIM_30260 [Brevundimonas diminuta ATCC 11568]